MNDFINYKRHRILLNIKIFFIYLFRWQLSTPIYAIIMGYLNNMSTTKSAIISNLVGAFIFFWIDRFIFSRASKHN